MPRGVYVRTEATRKAMSERMRGRIICPRCHGAFDALERGSNCA